jgi:hypothetical protein
VAEAETGVAEAETGAEPGNDGTGDGRELAGEQPEEPPGTGGPAESGEHSIDQAEPEAGAEPAEGTGQVAEASPQLADTGAAEAGEAHTEPTDVTPPAEDPAVQQAMDRYHALGDTPPHFDMASNDAQYGGQGAHTIERHGPDVPLARGDSPGQTIEGRIHGDPPWPHDENWSYRWADTDTMNRTINEYTSANWDTIRSDLAVTGQHSATFDAHRTTGEGYYNSGMWGTGPVSAEYSHARYATVNYRLAPGTDPPQPYILTSYPRPAPPVG